MMTARSTGTLLQRLPMVRGRYTENAPLAPATWFRVGGAAEILFRPHDFEDLAEFLAAKPADIPVTIIGVGSNLLVRDGGVPGVTIRLVRGCAEINIEGEVLKAGAGALDSTVAAQAAAAGIGGLEFLSGIPGTIGGGLRMNAGAYEAEFRDVLIEAKALDPTGKLVRLTPEMMDLGYRHCGVPEDWIFLEATVRGKAMDRTAIASRMAEIRDRRTGSQPVRARTGGSTFANPPHDSAWSLIDKARCRGLRRGDAMVSELHTNFLINLGAATSSDLEGLGEEVRRRVFETSGVTLRWEIRRVGLPLVQLQEVPNV